MDGLGDSTKSLLSITRRSTLSGRTNNVPAGRISHWAESFDSLMNDPLGVKHFKVCLHDLSSIKLFLQIYLIGLYFFFKEHYTLTGFLLTISLVKFWLIYLEI